MNADLPKELQVYKKLLIEDMNLFAGYSFSRVVTFDEYIEFRQVGQAIEEFLEEGFGEDVINEVRMSIM